MNLTSIGLIAAALSAAIVAGGGGWVVRGLVAEHIEIPRVISHQVEICTAKTATVAAQSARDEFLRQVGIGEVATKQFNKQSQLAADDLQAQLDLRELEIADYERQAEAGGGVCALDSDDLDFLGVRRQPGGTVPGGG